MSQERLRVLAVEDNPADFRLLQEYLKEGPLANFEVAHAKTLEEALKISSDEKFDIILLDLGLPDSTGLGGLDRAHKKNPVVPIIVLTGLGDEEIGVRALQKNAQDYLVKGKIQGDVLVRSMRYAIERKRAEATLRRLNRILKALSNSSRAMMQAISEPEYLQDVCRIIVDDCGYKLVWIGFAEQDENKTVLPVAWSGFEKGYLQKLNITWAETERGRGPTGTAIRTGKSCVCRDMFNDPNCAPWREEAGRRGYAASAALPLIANGKAFGALNIYAKEAQAFNEEDLRLLTELADDLAFGIISIRLREQHRKAAEELRRTHSLLEEKVAQRTDELTQSNRQLIKEILERKEIEKAIRIRSSILKAMSKASQRKEYLDILVKLIQGLTKCHCVGLRVLNEEGDIPYESYIGFSKEFWEKENWLSVSRDQCACIRVVLGEPVEQDKPCLSGGGSFVTNDALAFVSTLNKEGKVLFRGVCMQSGFHSVAVIPIRYKNDVIAAIHIADEQKNMLPAGLIEFIELLTPLIGEGIHKFDIEEGIRHSLIGQSIISKIIRFSFEETSLEKILMNSLELLFSMNWLAVESRGGVYLVDNEPNTLVLKAQKNLPEHVLKVCAKIPFGKCLCGSVAKDKKLHFTNSLDTSHETTYKGMPEHGHYCVPIMSGEKLLGVMNLYLSRDFRRDARKEDFLMLVANALAVIVQRKQDEGRLHATQMELGQARRLSDIGTLAATVAHELRNPLAAIRMAAFNIKRKAQNPLLDKHFINIEKKVAESDQIINNLLFYSRLKQPHYESVDLYKIVEECLEIAKRHAANNEVQVIKKYRVLNRILVDADPLQMKELFSNILNNAYDAMHAKPGSIEISATHDNEQAVSIRVKDTGVGMDEEHLKRAHEPFFTTKAKGTGLGLTVCFQIVNLHNGKLDLASEKGQGTTVTVSLPIKNGNS